MLKPTELRDLWRDLAGRQVLSVYLDTQVTDPAMRDAWRPALQNSIRAAGAHITDPEERARFDRAASHIWDSADPPRGIWGAPGWVAFATEDRLHHSGPLPVKPVPLAVWREGPLLAPYLRSLKQHRPVVIALVESRGIRLYRYALGQLERLEAATVPEEVLNANGANGSRGGAYPAARGSVDMSEATSRRRIAAFQRLTSELQGRIDELAGDDGWVLLGGTSEWVHHANEVLGRRFEDRLAVVNTLPHDAGDPQIIRAAKDAATELRSEHGRAIVGDLLDRAGSGSRAKVGVAPVQRALRARAVDLLLVSQEMVRTQPDLVEELVRLAIEQGATVEVPSGEASEQLDREAGGLAARLRFPIDEPLSAEERDVAEAEAPR